jgi:hypothetical protein
MIELDLQVVAMAPVTDDGKKKWVVHARRQEKHYKLVLTIGDDQYQMLTAELSNTPPTSAITMSRTS